MSELNDLLDGYRGELRDLARDRAWSGAELARARDQLHRELRDRGVQAGDRVVLAASNGAPFVIGLMAALQAQASPILMFARSPAPELLRAATSWAARFVLADRPALTDVASQAPSHWTTAALSWELTEPGGTSGDGTEFATTGGIPLHPTSGTSGPPKLAVRPSLCALEEARHYADTLGVGSADRLLTVVPMSHAYGYGMGMLVALLTSADLVADVEFHHRNAWRAIADHAITLFPATAAILDLLVKSRRGATSLPRVLTAGAPLTAQTIERYHGAFGSLPLQLYGTTETGGIAIDTEPELGRNCVGAPMDGVSVELRPAPHADGLPGELHVRSSSMMSGYLRAAASDATELASGWFNTGDLARIDADGRIHLRGRHAEVINTFGMKVLPAEVEQVLIEHPAIVEAKVYAGEHRSGSAIVKAAVVTDGPTTAADLIEHCRANLAEYKVPQIVQELERLPKTPSGKVIVRELP